MKTTYSIYEAKAKLSEIIRLVRKNRNVTITYHDEPVAQIVPIDLKPQSLEDQFIRLEKEGVLMLRQPKPLFSIQASHGALKRFLDSRE